MIRNRNAFTLVELLVVIAIISILAAMLLPTIEASLEQARRAKDLQDTRQIGLAALQFGNDHQDRVPTYYLPGKQAYYPSIRPLIARSHGLYIRDEMAQWGDGARQTIPSQFGILAGFGYVSDIAVFFCPSNTKSAAWHKTARNAPLLQGTWDTPAMTWQWINYLVTKADTLWANNRKNMTFGFIGENWKRRNDVGPCIFACLNGGDWASSGEYYRTVSSHGGEGLNVVFFDGGGRWLKKEETPIMVNDPLNRLKTEDEAGYFQAWQLKYMTRR